MAIVDNINQDIKSLLGLDPRVESSLQAIPADSSRKELLERLEKRCRSAREGFALEIDHSPVLAHPRAYAARIDHEEGRIVLNGHLLDRAPDSYGLSRFLETHELFHEVCRRASAEEKAGWLRELDLDEERACDLVALYALHYIA